MSSVCLSVCLGLGGGQGEEQRNQAKASSTPQSLTSGSKGALIPPLHLVHSKALWAY